MLKCNLCGKDFIEILGYVLGTLFLIVLVLYFVIIFNVLQINVEILNASIVMVLLFVTYLYTKHTARIVEETRNDRKVGFIQKKLEKLYYPLEDILNSIDIRCQGEDKIIVINYDPQKNKKWYSINDIIPFLYLASTELKIPMKTFTEIFREGKHIESDDIHQLIDKIKDIAKQDIERFKKELAELIG